MVLGGRHRPLSMGWARAPFRSSEQRLGRSQPRTRCKNRSPGAMVTIATSSRPAWWIRRGRSRKEPLRFDTDRNPLTSSRWRRRPYRPRPPIPPDPRPLPNTRDLVGRSPRAIHRRLPTRALSIDVEGQAARGGAPLRRPPRRLAGVAHHRRPGDRRQSPLRRSRRHASRERGNFAPVSVLKRIRVSGSPQRAARPRPSRCRSAASPVAIAACTPAVSSAGASDHADIDLGQKTSAPARQ